ncbi:MAG TPA: hypothetical protein VE464_12160, partial [Streptosporangiaceae bacterium]|nr:hypothetical protein [Streptosporangiaceae bacterium]
MASALHQQNTSPADYAAGLPAQFLYLGLLVAPLVGLALILPGLLPVVPIGDVHDLPAGEQRGTLGDTIGWPQLAGAVAAQDAALVRAGRPPTSIFTGYYGEAAPLDVLGAADHLPPVLSGHNAYWMWGPGTASDRTVRLIALIRARYYGHTPGPETSAWRRMAVPLT